nr:hypothetical protein [Tanacetum cinerariifolium]
MSLFKDDPLPKVSLLRVSDQNIYRNKLPDVRSIGRVSPLKSKSKVTGKSDPPKRRWILISERLLNKPGDDIVFNLQPICQYNPITRDVIKEYDKAPVVKEKPVDVIDKSNVVKESDKAQGKSLDVFKYKHKHKTGLPKDNQKDNPKDKESDKAPVVAVVVSGKSVVDEKDNRKEKPADVIEKLIVIKESDKASVVNESDKVPVVKESDKAPVVAPVLKEKSGDVIEKSTLVNEKEKPTVDVMSKVAKDKEKPVVDVTSKVGKSKAVVHKYRALDVVSKDKPNGISSSVFGKGNAPFVVGLSNDKPSVVKGKLSTELPKNKHKADIPKDKPKPKDKHKEDHGKKKLELKMIKGKMVSDEVDSDEVLVRFTMFPLIKYHRGWEDVKPIEHEFVRSWVDQFYPKSLNEIRVGDIASKIFLDVVRRLHEESVISEIDWCVYIHSFFEDSKLLEKPTLYYLGPFTFLILLHLDSIKFDSFPVIRTRPAIRDWTSTLMRKIQDLETKEQVIGYLDFHNEWTESELQKTESFTRVSSLETSEREFVELQEKYVQVFKDPISSDVDVYSVDGGNDSDGDDNKEDDNDDRNENNDEELNDDNDDEKVVCSAFEVVWPQKAWYGRYIAFGRHLEEIHVTWAHLEKKPTRLRTYTNISQDYVLGGRRRRHKIQSHDGVTRFHDGVSSHDPAQDLEYSLL